MMSEHDQAARIAARVVPGGTPGRRWSLEGGVSARVEGLEVRSPDGSVRRVVLRYPRAGVSCEYALLEQLCQRDVPVPAPCFADPEGDWLGAPGFVMEMIDGVSTVEAAALPDALDKMADMLAQLHALDLEGLNSLALPPREDPVEGALIYLPQRAEHAAVRDALKSIGHSRPRHKPTLLHGDFWPGNLLWREGAIVAVLDWEDAAIGDPLSDLAGARVELLWRYGQDAMEAFTEAYLRRANLDLFELPIWELYVASAGATSMSQWGLSSSTEQRMRDRAGWLMKRASATLLTR